MGEAEKITNILILFLSLCILGLTIFYSEGLDIRDINAAPEPNFERPILIPFAEYVPLTEEALRSRQKTFGAQSFTLPNGLQGIVIPNHRAPVVTHMIWYKAGAADEPPGVSGIAHFMEHLMFKGSTTISGQELAPGEFSKIVRSLGGQDNAFTSQDYTAYFQSAAAEHLETLMDMEAGRMMGFNPPHEQVKSERQVILEERRQRTDNSPAGRFNEYLMAALHPHHPYGTPIIGWYHEMEQLGRQDALDFHDVYYAPNNAILVVAGDVDVDEVERLALQTYGQVPARYTPPRQRTQNPPLDGRAVITHKDPRVRQPQWQRIYIAPSMATNRDEAMALDILSDILGGGSTSRLYKSLVIDQKLASAAASYYRADGLDNGHFYISVTPLPGIEMAQIEAAVDAELDQIANEIIPADEKTAAVNRLKDSAIYARDSLSGPARIIGMALTTGGSLNDIEHWAYLIDKITADQVQNAAASYIAADSDDARYVTGHLLPEDTP